MERGQLGSETSHTQMYATWLKFDEERVAICAIRQWQSASNVAQSGTKRANKAIDIVYSTQPSIFLIKTRLFSHVHETLIAPD